jgi:hypothetical protein
MMDRLPMYTLRVNGKWIFLGIEVRILDKLKRLLVGK